MGYETDILEDLLTMPVKARVALLVSALDALQRSGVHDLVKGARREFPTIAPPQLLQQSLLTIMAFARVGTPTATQALFPIAARSYGALSYHLDEEPTRAVDPFAIALWGLIESLFPEDLDLPLIGKGS